MDANGELQNCPMWMYRLWILRFNHKHVDKPHVLRDQKLIAGTTFSFPEASYSLGGHLFTLCWKLMRQLSLTPRTHIGVYLGTLLCYISVMLLHMYAIFLSSDREKVRRCLVRRSDGVVSSHLQLQFLKC